MTKAEAQHIVLGARCKYAEFQELIEGLENITKWLSGDHDIYCMEKGQCFSAVDDSMSDLFRVLDKSLNELP